MFSTSVHAKDMTLLAVTGEGSNMLGSGAELNLVITDGTGRVFMETVPFTKLDTQMSTHFAKEVACNYLDIDCSRYDFFYTIKSNSAIIGGPSAGAAITFLTIAKLKHMGIPQDFSVTGTINTGGTVGRVGGVKEKILAASNLGLKTVYIPKGDRFYSDSEDLLINMTEDGDITGIKSNESAAKNRIDLVRFGEENGVTVIEISTIDDLMCKILHENCLNLTGKIETNQEYNLTMLGIGISICNRTNSLVTKINNPILEYDLRNNIINMSLEGLDMPSLIDLMIKGRWRSTMDDTIQWHHFVFPQT
jgi:predicted S18 family serine protease